MEVRTIELTFYNRAKLFIHDGTILAGCFAVLLCLGIMTGCIKGIAGWYSSQNTFAFNVEGKDYIQKGK